ncbi:hypothetical protein GLV94_11035 [Virgibacillus halodenitrificans]|uniref:DUF6944 family repetitive protein n=1 Tax=Virgibacillus halodenitrificans TaxID=1482 RepID=UPI00136F7034|nr:hypothetical protein [Virgibacillus halodenitrificans]MYL46187.1 hypothetical protein [Virgibacillus halodenitrificans]
MNHIAVMGGWIQASGTVINAIEPAFSETNSKVFAKAGNMLQAIGNAIISENSSIIVNKIANEVQSTGNLVVVVGLYQKNITLEIQGNLIQAVGAGVGFTHAVRENNLVEAIGDLLQTIGNSLQSISGIIEKEEKVDASLLDYTGAWIQAGGAIISAIHLTIENETHKNYYYEAYNLVY